MSSAMPTGGAVESELHIIAVKRTADGRLGVGIGQNEAGELVVASIIEHTPAASSQLKLNDRLVSVNGQFLRPGQHLGEVLAQLEKDEYVQLGVMRSPEPEPEHQIDVADEPELSEGPQPEAGLIDSEVTGMQLYTQGRLLEAEPLLVSTLRQRRTTLGNRHPCTLAAMNSLASLLQDLNRQKAAEALYKEALALHEEVARRGAAVGNDRQAVALRYEALITSHNLGKLLQAQGRAAEATPLLKHALSTCNLLLGEDHEHTRALAASLSAAPLLC